MKIFVCVCFIQEDKGDLTLLLCGDLNSNPRSGVIQYITSGNLPENAVDWYTSKYKYVVT